MIAWILNIYLIIFFFYKSMYLFNCRWLIIITTNVHYLSAKSFILSKEFNLRKILLFLLSSCLNCPIKFFFCNKIRQSNHRYPGEVLLVSIINFLLILLTTIVLQVVALHNQNILEFYAHFFCSS